MRPPWATLLTIDEALALVLERVAAAAAEPVPLEEAAGRVLAEAAHGRRRPAAVRELGDGRLRACARPTFPGRCRSSTGSPRAARRRGPRRRARRWRSPPAASSRMAPTPSSRSSMLSNMTTASRSRRCCARARTFAPRGGDVARGRRGRAPPARGSAPAQLGALAAAGVADGRVRAAAARRRAHDGHRAARARASRSAPGRSTRRTASCSRPQLAAARRRRRALAAVADDEAAHRAALERGLEADVLVTSGGVSVGPHDLVRRDRGRARRRGGLLARRGQAGQAGRRSACAARRSCSGCPGTRSRRSSASSSSSARRSRAAGRSRPVPAFAPGRLAARCGGTRRATSSCARDRARPGRRRARAAVAARSRT